MCLLAGGPLLAAPRVSQLAFFRAVASQYSQVGKREAAALRKHTKEDWLVCKVKDIAEDWKPDGNSKLWRLAKRCLGKNKPERSF